MSFSDFKESHFILAIEQGIYSAKYINHQERATINYYRISKVAFVFTENFLPFAGSNEETLVTMLLTANKRKFNFEMS